MPSQLLKNAAARTVGLLPAAEAVNWVRLGPASLPLRRFERSETRRLLERTGGPHAATVATVIPTYRRPDLLVRAVASALAQTVRDQVIVVVDDGGGGLGALPDDPRLVAVSLQRNTHTLGLVRNIGLGLSRSTFVAFLDDDNVWLPHHLETALAALQPGVDVVYTSARRRFADGDGLDVLDSPFDRSRMRAESIVDANTIVVRRGPGVRFSVLPRGRDTIPKEDWEFVWRTSRRARVRHVDAVTVDYLVHDGSFYTDWARWGVLPDVPAERPETVP